MNDAPLQECERCGHEKPLEEGFWHRDRARKSGFKKICKTCREIEKGEQDQEHKDKLLEKIEEHGRGILSKLVEIDPRKGGKTPHIAELFQHIMHVFGGSEGFAKQIAATYFAAPQGGATRQRILSDVARMGAKVSEQGFLERDFDHVSTEDLERLLDSRFPNVISVPALAVKEVDEEKLRSNAG